MKNFIYLFLMLSAMMFNTSLSSCEIYDHAEKRISDITCLINKFDEEICYNKNMDFHMGYIHGQRQAFFEVKTLIDQLYPN